MTSLFHHSEKRRTPNLNQQAESAATDSTEGAFEQIQLQTSSRSVHRIRASVFIASEVNSTLLHSCCVIRVVGIQQGVGHMKNHEKNGKKLSPSLLVGFHPSLRDGLDGDIGSVVFLCPNMRGRDTPCPFEVQPIRSQVVPDGGKRISILASVGHPPKSEPQSYKARYCGAAH